MRRPIRVSPAGKCPPGLPASSAAVLHRRRLAALGKKQQSEARGDAAQKRASGKKGDAYQKETLASEPANEEAADRKHNGVRHQVTGQDPRALIIARAHAASDVWKCHVRYAGIERLHECSE